MRTAVCLAIVALASVAHADPPGDVLAALTAAMSERLRPAHDLVTWIDRDGERVVAAMLECHNAEPCVAWARLDVGGAVIAHGNFSLEFPRRLTVRDVNRDGRPELIVEGEYFTGTSPGYAASREVWSFPRRASEPVRIRVWREPPPR